MKSSALALVFLLGCGSARAPLPSPAPGSWVGALPPPGAPAELPPLTMPPIRSWTLPSGLTVQLVEKPGVPVVFAALVGRGGHALEEGTSSELNALVEGALGAELPMGTSDRSEQEDLAVARMTDRGLVLTSRVVAGDLEPALRRFASVLAGRAPGEDAILRARGALVERATYLTRRRARRRFPPPDEELRRRLYGNEDPRVRRDWLLPNLVAALEPATVRGRLSRLLTPRDTALIIVGDIDAAEVEQQIEREFGELREQPEAPAPGRAPAPSFPDPETRLVLHGTGPSPVARVRLAERGPPAEHDDYPAFRLFSRLAGGLFSSQLNLTLREQRGDAYGVVGRVADRDDHSLLEIYVQVRQSAAGDAAAAIIAELTRLCDPAQIGDEELERARAVELAELRAQLESPTELGRALISAFAARQPPDASLQTYARVASLTAEDVAAVSRRWVRPEAAPMVVVGHHSWLLAHPIQVAGGVGFVDEIYR